MIVNAIIQARMGSKRFPGKVMTDLAGKPVIGHLLDRMEKCKKIDNIIVAIPPADAEGTLGSYLAARDATVVTGPEQDVAARFLVALDNYHCDGFVRICADSPMLWPILVDNAATMLRDGVLFAPVSAGFAGLQCHGVNTDFFRSCYEEMTEEEREHVTLAMVRLFSLLVDEPGDIKRIEALNAIWQPWSFS